MKDRLLKFINDKQLSSTKLAELIGVQPSSISHILSGRNKPSFDFIHKLLSHFKDLNADWLLLGNGMMYKNNEVPNHEHNEVQPDLFTQKNSVFIKKEEPIEPKEEQNPLEELKSIPNEKNHMDVEQVIIFYTDGSFKSYKNRV